MRNFCSLLSSIWKRQNLSNPCYLHFPFSVLFFHFGEFCWQFWITGLHHGKKGEAKLRTSAMRVSETSPMPSGLALVCDGWMLGIKSWSPMNTLAIVFGASRRESWRPAFTQQSVQQKAEWAAQWHQGQEVAVCLVCEWGMRGDWLGATPWKLPESVWAEVTSSSVPHMQASVLVTA